MAGRHAAGGMGDFIRGLTLFILKWFLFGAAVFLIIWTVIVKVPDWFPGDDEAGTPTAIETTTTLLSDPVVAPSSTVAVRTTTTLPTAATGTTVEGLATTTTTEAPATTTTVAVESVDLSPSEITVRVLNSTGRAGLAATVTSNLAALGYDMLEQTNYTPALSTTTVFYVPGYDEAAADLAAELPGAVSVQSNPSETPSADLLVVLGASYP